MTPKCVICKKEYTDGTKFCPDDGGEVIREVFHRQERQPFAMGSKLSEAEILKLIGKEYTVKTGDYIKNGWELFTSNFGIFIGFAAIFLCINAILYFATVLKFLATWVVIGPLYAGYFIVAFKLLNKRSVEFSDFFQGFTMFLPLFLASLITGIFTLLGFILLVLPGIYLAVAYILVIPLIVDKNLDFWQAMEVSRRFVTRNWFPFFGFGALLFLINLLGVITCGVGTLITVPLTACAITCAYRDTIG